MYVCKPSSQPASRLLPKLHLVGDTNDTASRTGTRVTSLLGLGVVALAEVVGSAVDDDGALREALVDAAFRDTGEGEYSRQ